MDVTNYTTMDLANMILQEKTNKITPENIRHDVQVFDIVGTYRGDTGAAYSPKRIQFSGIGMDSSNKESAYYSGRNLDIFDAEHLDISNATNLDYTFYFTRSLTTLRGLNNWNTSNITSLANSFFELAYIPNVNELSNWDTSKVTNMYKTFYNCLTLNDISGLINWDTTNVKNYSRMFFNCTNLIDISNLSNWNITAARFSEMFYADRNLTTLPDWDTTTVQYFDSTFVNCTNLTNLPNWNVTNAYNWYLTFSGCSNLRNLSGFDGLFVNSNFQLTFSGVPFTFPVNRVINCRFLTSALPLRDNLSYINNSVEFINCDMASPFGTYYPKTMQPINMVFIGTNCNMHSWFSAENGSTSSFLNYSGSYYINGCSIDYMFYYQQNLTNIQDIQLTNCNNAYNTFTNCYKLTTLGNNMNIHFSTTGSLLNLSYMFYNCRLLRDTTCMENWSFTDRGSISRYINIMWMFEYCNNLSDESLYAITNFFIKIAPNVLSDRMNLSNMNYYSPFSSTNIQINARLSTDQRNRLGRAGYYGF
jgi:surface protein